MLPIRPQRRPARPQQRRRRRASPTQADPPGHAGASTWATGAAHELLAWEHLQAQGYVFVARNVRVPGGELDLIAKDGEVLCFIEVRSRRTAAFGHPLETIDAAKQRRVALAAATWLQKNPYNGPCRFDAVGMVVPSDDGPADITVVRGAFVPTRVF